MNEIDFLKCMNEIDHELLDDSPKSKRSIRPRFLRRFAIAAALLLLLGGTTAYAISGGIDLRKTSYPGGDQGFSVKTSTPLVKWSSFKGEVRNAGSVIAEQYATFTPAPWYSSTFTDKSSYSVGFDSIGEAMDYIGLKGLKTPPYPYDDYDCAVSAHGDAEGRVDSVEMYIAHINNYEPTAQEYVTIKTEYADNGEHISGGAWTPSFPRDVEFLSYTTRGGNECRIAVLSPAYDSDYMGLSGYVLCGSAFYQLHLGAVPKTDYDHAIDILHAWADGLD